MLSAASKSFLLDLLSTPSPTGFESRGQHKWTAQARKSADLAVVLNDADIQRRVAQIESEKPPT